MTPKEHILSALKKGNLSGSWLIQGPSGIGKKKFTKELIGFLLTGDWKDCASSINQVKWIQKGLTDEAKKDIQKNLLSGKLISEEIMSSYAQKNEITVDDIHQMGQFLSLKSNNDDWRIVVISLADEMNENAQNALLKMLEEPSNKVLILLLCQNKANLLPTIISRCRQITISLVSEDEFRKIIQLHSSTLSSEEENTLFFLSQGSIGQALDILSLDGINLYKDLLSFFTPLNQINFIQLFSFADKVVNPPALFSLIQNYIFLWCREHSLKEKAILDLYPEFKSLFYKCNSLYLDKKMVFLNCIFKIGETLK